MRITRLLATGLALALVPALAQAQEGRQFTDSWFWGVKAVNMSYWTTSGQEGQAQGLGGEWMLTKTRAALLIGVERYSFGDVYDFDDTETSSVNGKPVEMTGMSRVAATLLAFPKNIGGLRPYAGVGFAYNRIDATVAAGSDASPSDLSDASTAISPTLLGGIQAQYRRFSVFGQATLQASRAHGFLLSANEAYFIEAGIRYNFGSAVEGDR